MSRSLRGPDPLPARTTGGGYTGAMDAGAAYLFSTNGALLTTFSNPTPATGELFGYAVAALGSDRVLIGKPNDATGVGGAGVVYLFSTNGALLMTLTNPTPVNSDHFGWSVAAVGSDQVLIGTPFNDMGADAAGIAYLVSTNGTLLTTFTNPAPTAEDLFGWSVAAIGTDKVLIGAHGDKTGASTAGAAYLFSASGALLTTFTNPTPANLDEFGYSVTAVGADMVLIGAHFDDTSSGNAGVAYLFSAVQSPSLDIYLTSTNTVALSWPSALTDWMLQQNTNTVSSLNWSNVTNGIEVNGATKTFVVNPPTGNRFYRLSKP